MFIPIFQKWRCVFLTQNKLQILSSHDLVPHFFGSKNDSVFSIKSKECLTSEKKQEVSNLKRNNNQFCSNKSENLNLSGWKTCILDKPIIKK